MIIPSVVDNRVVLVHLNLSTSTPNLSTSTPRGPVTTAVPVLPSQGPGKRPSRGLLSTSVTSKGSTFKAVSETLDTVIDKILGFITTEPSWDVVTISPTTPRSLMKKAREVLWTKTGLRVDNPSALPVGYMVTCASVAHIRTQFPEVKDPGSGKTVAGVITYLNRYTVAKADPGIFLGAPLGRVMIGPVQVKSYWVWSELGLLHRSMAAQVPVATLKAGPVTCNFCSTPHYADITCGSCREVIDLTDEAGKSIMGGD